jgi:hypothetical protein
LLQRTRFGFTWRGGLTVLGSRGDGFGAVEEPRGSETLRRVAELGTDESPSRGSRTEARVEKASEGQNGQVRIGRGVWATRLRANGLAEGTKLRSGVKRIRAVTRIDLAQDDREAQCFSRRLPSLLRSALLLERDSIVGGGQQPSPLRYQSFWGIRAPRGPVSQVERQALRSAVGSLAGPFALSFEKGEAPKRCRELLKTDGDKAGTVPPGRFGEQPQGSQRLGDERATSVRGNLRRRKAWTRLRHETRPRTSSMRKPLRS